MRQIDAPLFQTQIPRVVKPGLLKDGVKFKGALPANAMSQLAADTMGVWAPKIPLTRSKQGFFEDAFLEWAENIPFYLLVPAAAPLFAKLFAGKRLSPKDIGSSWSVLGKKAIAKAGDSAIGKDLLGAKVGTLLSVLSLSWGWEYMVQHTKNYITAKHLKTTNFEAVAGLEGKTTKVKRGNADPVKKAKKRAKQVGAAVLSGLFLAAAAPKMIEKSLRVENMARKMMRYFNFSGDSFDLNKPILASVIGVGVMSYLDAARDKLELKETASRLSLIVPYLLFGKEVSGNLLAKLFNHSKVDGIQGTEKVAIKDVLKGLKSSKTGEAGPDFSFRKEGSLWQKFKTPESFLDLSHFKTKEDVAREFGALAEKGFNIPESTKVAIASKLGQVSLGQFVLGALISGVGITWLSYNQTNRRWSHAQEQESASAPASITSPKDSSGAVRNQLPFQLVGRNPLSQPATRVASNIPLTSLSGSSEPDAQMLFQNNAFLARDQNAWQRNNVYQQRRYQQHR